MYELKCPSQFTQNIIAGQRTLDHSSQKSKLTHKILVIVVVAVVNDPVPVLLVVPAEPAGTVLAGVDGAPAREARLAQALVEALAQAPTRDLRVELAAQPGVPEALEGSVRTPAVRKQVRGDAIVRVFGASCYGRIYVS